MVYNFAVKVKHILYIPARRLSSEMALEVVMAICMSCYCLVEGFGQFYNMWSFFGINNVSCDRGQ